MWEGSKKDFNISDSDSEYFLLNVFSNYPYLIMRFLFIFMLHTQYSGSWCVWDANRFGLVAKAELLKSSSYDVWWAKEIIFGHLEWTNIFDQVTFLNLPEFWVIFYFSRRSNLSIWATQWWFGANFAMATSLYSGCIVVGF